MAERCIPTSERGLALSAAIMRDKIQAMRAAERSEERIADFGHLMCEAELREVPR